MGRLMGLKDLLHDAVDGTVDLVERQQGFVARKQVARLQRVRALREPVGTVDTIVRLVSASVFDSIRGVNGIVRAATGLGAAVGEAVARALGPHASAERGSSARLVDLAQGALNGAIGDRLARSGNALEIPMHFRVDGRELELERDAVARALPMATPRLAIFVHGLSCTERMWELHAERYWGDSTLSFGKLLRRDLGYTPLYVRYNSGRHVSENGRRLCELIAGIVRVYPMPVDEIALVGHSMGGLVARSAAHYDAEVAATRRLRHVVCIGSPHQGAPLEKATNLLAGLLGGFDHPATRVPAELLNARSSGIKDLRFGNVVDEDWKDHEPDAVLCDSRTNIPLVDGVAYGSIASTLTRDPRHVMGRILGDLLVRLPSAAGACANPARRIQFPLGRVFGGMNHLELLNHPDVYEQLRDWLARPSTARSHALRM